MAVAVVVAAAAFGPACADGGLNVGAGRPATTTGAPTTAGAPTTTGAGQFQPEPVQWESCGNSLECANLAVPLDYDDPAGPTITLALARIPAGDPAERIGALLVNPGGPGASGIDFVSVGELFDSDVHDRFDVIGWDPRGVGQSTGLRCGGDLVDEFLELDSDPDDVGEQSALEQAARAIADDCAADDGHMLAHVGTADVVRDMDTIRLAIGEQTISYVGFSYGTLLGQRYAEAFPAGARAIVLDGVVDPSHDFREFLTAQTEAFERTIQEVFDACDSSTPDCPDIGASEAYDRILARVEVEPLPAGGNDFLGPGDLATAAIYVTYSPTLWRRFYAALADGLENDGEALRDLAEGYRSFGGFTSYVAVECVDTPHPVGAAEYADFAADLEAVSPRFGAAIANELLPCAFWPVPGGADPGPVLAPDAPPILVIGNTGDAATPFEQAERVAATLADAVLLTYEGEGHTSFGSSPCVDDFVTAYLLDLRLPAPGTVCE